MTHSWTPRNANKHPQATATMTPDVIVCLLLLLLLSGILGYRNRISTILRPHLPPFAYYTAIGTVFCWSFTLMAQTVFFIAFGLFSYALATSAILTVIFTGLVLYRKAINATLRPYYTVIMHYVAVRLGIAFFGGLSAYIYMYYNFTGEFSFNAITALGFGIVGIIMFHKTIYNSLRSYALVFIGYFIVEYIIAVPLVALTQYILTQYALTQYTPTG